MLRPKSVALPVLILADCLCRLCTDLAALVVERAEIEKMYAQKLKSWAVKWNTAIEKGANFNVHRES